MTELLWVNPRQLTSTTWLTRLFTWLTVTQLCCEYALFLTGLYIRGPATTTPPGGVGRLARRAGFGLGFGEWLGDGEGLGDVLGEVLGDGSGSARADRRVGLGDGVLEDVVAVRLACAAALPIDGMSTTLRATAAAPASAHARRSNAMPLRRGPLGLVRRGTPGHPGAIA